MLVVDIETIPDLKDEVYVNYKSSALMRKGLSKAETIESHKKEVIRDKFALSPLTGKLICGGFLSDMQLPEAPLTEHTVLNKAGEDTLLYYDAILSDNELGLLVDTLHTIQRYLDNGHRIVTYNGNDFDIPFIVRRAIFNNLECPANFPTLDNLTNKYRPQYHLDLKMVLNPSYAEQQRSGKLSEWAYLLGATSDLGGNGGEVYEQYLTKDFDGIKNHCIADIVKTYFIYQAIKSWVSIHEYI